jgi:tRNA (pseudouridine54-N1)-methyltransferase
MRTFILRARKGSTRYDKIRAQVGANEHFEVVLHSIMNAFFVASSFRQDVEFYLVLDSAEDFPKTIYLNSAQGLSLEGFHESAILKLLEETLKNAHRLSLGDELEVAKGVKILGFGFEKLVAQLITHRPLFLLEPKGQSIRAFNLPENPVFILSDHLAMPKKNIQSLKRRGLQTISLGPRMLFASQCVVLLNHELDIQM